MVSDTQRLPSAYAAASTSSWQGRRQGFRQGWANIYLIKFGDKLLPGSFLTTAKISSVGNAHP